LHPVALSGIPLSTCGDSTDSPPRPLRPTFVQGDNARTSAEDDMNTYPLEYFDSLLTFERDHAAELHENEKLAAVDRAIETLHRDPTHYGLCVICGLQIDPDRLRIVPATQYCEDDAEIRASSVALQTA
jgi:RNA polymerase-binding transcription factor DksA